ncbi:uncharacterized protein A1O9_08487 [Exophiala aquamarina CBS 119918]|uniref:Xylanolytic transcriptional activator regulatory domain-containing protein n=1 Tax=Exophiala aquamarina CBS 119918 TaxID=1182545 RepID=A0A072P7N4_9EURO|nr:uncharacterized protein A1O9_08487 [Exophiala aquamarina CBS 119918]KEF55737.1 hypothetical protein A1O9_08487 [Exophiala aquamarina CBS 119918]
MMKTPSQFDSGEAPWERLESPVYSVAISNCQDTGGYHTFREDIEYWGPRTSMSICSLAGIAWVKERVKLKQPDFQATANDFTQNVARMLKLEKQPTKRRKEEPGFDDALRFTKAFFEETPEAALGIVQRSCFESRLRSFYKSSKNEDNFSWFAMRNIIFAYGCRVVSSKTASYSEAQQESWSYFENALSVHTEILCFRTSVMGAQALTLMAYFAEAVSCRMVQYILVATAYRLACGQGLHTRPSPSWKLPEGEKSLRQSVFWAIYCLDKQISCRSGRPSIIDDEEINCNLPNPNGTDGSVSMRYIQAYIKISHLSSITRKMLSKAAGCRQAPQELVDNVLKLDVKLEDLRINLQNQCQIDLPMKLTELPAGLDMRQAISLQFLYYNLVWDIHTTLAHPWFRDIIGLERYSEFQSQIVNSCAIVAETSRAVILDCRLIQIDASCPMSVAYYSPLYAVVNLFIGILHDPSLGSSRTDLYLMDVATGYFARLEYSTDSQWSVPLVKDVAILARSAVETPIGAPSHIHSDVENLPTANSSFSSPEPMSEPATDGNGITRDVRTPSTQNTTVADSNQYLVAKLESE